MHELYLIAGMGIITFLIRYSLIAISGQVTLSDAFSRALRYVPPTVLTAIVVPAVLSPDQSVAFGLANARLIGALAALGVGLWRKQLLLTILVGMSVFFGWQWLVLPLL
ncbi:AzlD domain-containing protein [Almyronema epifaneia]|uniref:AzlD domain-containing protein n=1 Tax=Almyronema epifaneia S1 TaxID=2991925 RepID=A0ABW6IJG8_9CYAN